MKKTSKGPTAPEKEKSKDQKLLVKRTFLPDTCPLGVDGVERQQSLLEVALYRADRMR
jgi:hypothetical protein